MELRHLRYFVAAAEAENVLRAATRKLHVSQPAVSRQIRDLEEEVGVQLFVRTGKSVRLTNRGRRFLKDARAILKRADDAVRNLRSSAEVEEARLDVGYVMLPTAQVLAATMRAFQEALPHVNVRLHDWTNEENIAALREGRLDLAFVIRPPKRFTIHGLRFKELVRERIRLVVSPKHPFARRRSIPLAKAAQERFLALARKRFPNYNAHFAEIFARVKNKPKVIERHDSITSLISAVEAGRGVGIAVDAARHTFSNRVSLVRLTPEPKPVAFGIACKSGQLGTAAAKFWECAKEVTSGKDSTKTA